MRAFLAILIIPFSGFGMIFVDVADPAANKQTAPTGQYANSGWKYQVRYKEYLGTMISPKHFISATHLGEQGLTTQPSFFNGSESRTFTLKNGGTRIIIQNTDLSVFEIWETFEDYAPLYTKTNETGKEVIQFGRGVGRGDELISGGQVVGWKWGPFPEAIDRWGVNEITSNFSTSSGLDFIYTTFDQNGGINECQLTGNDSGGGWFIKDGNIWKLAAVTASVDANHDTNNTTGDSSHFRAAITKARGFYYGSDSNGWNLIPSNSSNYSNPASYETNPNDVRFYDRTHSYGSRISSFLPDINTLIQPAMTHSALDGDGKFQSWLTNAGVITETDPSADPDQDRTSNLTEYFANSDPTAKGISPFEVTQEEDGTLNFTLYESLDLSGRNLNGEIQKSTDLSIWTPLENLIETSNVINAVTGQRVKTFELASPQSDQNFYRLQVTLSN